MSHHNTADYYALIESLIADQQEVWGGLAIEIANAVPGLVVSENGAEPGDLWVNGNGKAIAGALAESYIERFGQSAAKSLQAVAREYDDDVELPDVLQT